MKSVTAWLRRRGKTPSPAKEGARGGLGSLPLELHFYVLEHLNAEDFLTAICVCRTWRYIWLSDEVWSWAATRWFPGLLQHITSSEEAGVQGSELFRETLVKSVLRKHGHFTYAHLQRLDLENDRFFKLSRAVPVRDGGLHSYSEVREPEPDIERFARYRLYNCGRIAWWPEPFALPYVAVVDDLRTRIRRLYSFPGHHEDRFGYQIAMGDTLFLMGKEQTLHAWHLKTNAHCSIELPYQFKRCITEGESVLIITKDSAIYLWNFGQPLREIDMTGLYTKAPVTWGDQGDFVPSVLGPHRVGLWLRLTNIAVDFIIHPTVRNTFFIVTLNGGLLTVHEMRDGNLVGSSIMDESLLSRRALERAGQLRWEKSDSRGGYNLLSIYPMPRGSPNEDADLEDLCREISCRCQTWWSVGGHTLVSVCFNVYTKSFAVLRHQPPSYYRPKSFYIWNEQLFAASKPDGPNGWHVAAFKKYTGWSDAKSFASVPAYSTSTSKSGDSYTGKRRRMPMEDFELYGLDIHAGVFHDVEYMLDGNRKSDRARVQPRYQPTENVRIVGDDDYLMFFEGGSYTAWYFGQSPSKK